MSRNLYDVIEDFDTLRTELSYYLRSNKSYIEVEVGDNYSRDSDFLQILSGIEFSNERLLGRFETLSNELTEIMRAKRNDNN